MAKFSWLCMLAKLSSGIHLLNCPSNPSSCENGVKFLMLGLSNCEDIHLSSQHFITQFQHSLTLIASLKQNNGFPCSLQSHSIDSIYLDTAKLFDKPSIQILAKKDLKKITTLKFINYTAGSLFVEMAKHNHSQPLYLDFSLYSSQLSHYVLDVRHGVGGIRFEYNSEIEGTFTRSGSIYLTPSELSLLEVWADISSNFDQLAQHLEDHATIN